MFLLTTPSDAEACAVLAEVADRPVNHPHTGLTRERLDRAPPGFQLDQYGMELGEGDALFDHASRILADYQHYPSSFTRVVRATPNLEVGQVFGTVATHFGFASLHPCRVVFIIREEWPRRFGFGLGTLPGHIEAGEECFELSQAEPGGLVRYDVRAISRPDGFMPQLGRPLIRGFQRRFQRETLEEMRRRCATASSTVE